MKNITKKVISLLLLMTMALTSVVFAAEEVKPTTLTASLDAAAKALSVSGEVASSVTKANSTVILRYIKGVKTVVDGEDVWSYSDADNMFTEFTKTYYDAITGRIKFDFGTIQLPSDIAEGMYRAEISCSDFVEKLQYDHQYSKPTVVRDALKAVKDATETTVFEVLDENNKVLGLDTTDYDKIAASTDSAGKTAFAAIMKDDSTLFDGLVLDNAASDAAVAEGNKIVMGKLTQKVKEASAAGIFVIITNKSGFDSWYSKYVKQSGVINANAVIETLPFEDDADIFSLVRGEAEFIRRIALAEGKMTLDEIRTYITEHALLTRIVTGTPTEIATMLASYNTMFKEGSDALDWADYKALDDTIKSEVIAAIKGKSYKDMAEAVEKINDAIGADYGTDDGGSGGSSGGNGGTRPVYMPNQPAIEETDETTALFTDMNDSHWANEAVEYLFAKKVVNGNPDGTFAPENNVTRAEFIKMIISAMGVESESKEVPFKDVAEDSWYAPYIAAAYNNGLLMGDENGNCSPEANITRQDMATILYRAVGATYEGDALGMFTDAAEIADYAKTAVSYFVEEGVINGLGDGRFGGHEKATRAQTAVIIYRIISAK